MKRFNSIFTTTVFFLSVLLISACQPIVVAGTEVGSQTTIQQDGEQMAADTATIEKLLSETYGSLVMAHDAAGYADLYAEDVLWVPPNGPDQTSKAGIEAGIQGLFDKFSFQVNPQPEEIEVRGDFASVVGAVDGVLTPRAGGDPNTIKFRIFWLLRKEAGDWKIYRQIWNDKPVVTDETVADAAPAGPEVVTVEDKIANVMSAGPAEIAEEATILDYPEGWPGNWPDEPAEEFVELRSGSNGWTCIADAPDTPGNDPMCLNETQFGMVRARYAKIDPPSTGVGVGYMLQEGGPAGSPPHLMIFAPGSRKELTTFSTEVNPTTWATGWLCSPKLPTST